MVAINKAIAKAAFVSCQNNLRNLGGMIQEYTLRNGSMLPDFGGRYWDEKAQAWKNTDGYRWIGQIGYLEGGELGWTLGSELPPDIQTGLQNKLGTFDATGMYFPIYDREDSLFVCPTGRKQLLNLQGVRSSYSGLSIRDYQNVDGIEDPMRALLLFEYDANEVNVLYADQSTEISYITDTVQRPDPGQAIPAELYRVALNHGDGDCGNVLFMDKHIECVKGEETLILSWEEDYSTSSSTTSTSTTSTSTTSTTTSTVRTTTTPTTTVGTGGGGGGSDDPIIGGTSSITGPGSGTTTTIKMPGDDGGGGAATSSVATTSTSTTTTSISTTTSTSSTTIRRYLGPPF
jgi:hypothetical protein